MVTITPNKLSDSANKNSFNNQPNQMLSPNSQQIMVLFIAMATEQNDNFFFTKFYLCKTFRE